MRLKTITGTATQANDWLPNKGLQHQLYGSSRQEMTLKQVPGYNIVCPLSYAYMLTGSSFTSSAARHPISSAFCEIMNVDHQTFRAGDSWSYEWQNPSTNLWYNNSRYVNDTYEEDDTVVTGPGTNSDTDPSTDKEKSTTLYGCDPDYISGWIKIDHTFAQAAKPLSLHHFTTGVQYNHNSPPPKHPLYQHPY